MCERVLRSATKPTREGRRPHLFALDKLLRELLQLRFERVPLLLELLDVLLLLLHDEQCLALLGLQCLLRLPERLLQLCGSKRQSTRDETHQQRERERESE
jgi:hypothetical protein